MIVQCCIALGIGSKRSPDEPPGPARWAGPRVNFAKSGIDICGEIGPAFRVPLMRATCYLLNRESWRAEIPQDERGARVHAAFFAFYKFVFSFTVSISALLLLLLLAATA